VAGVLTLLLQAQTLTALGDDADATMLAPATDPGR